MPNTSPVAKKASEDQNSQELVAVNQRLAEIQAQKKAAEQNWWSTTNAMTISSVVLAFGLVVMILSTYLIRVGRSSEAVLRIFGTILIIIAALFLVVAGYSDKQIAPVMGLLGTIAGYLLGKNTDEKKVECKPAERKSEEPKPGEKKD